MWNMRPQDRLCEEILGGKISKSQWDDTTILIPTRYADISADVLFTTMEAVYDYSPEHVRLMLPFVLDALEKNRSDLLVTGYFNAYLFHINYDFLSPKEGVSLPDVSHVGPTYSSDYRQGWIIPTISAMNRFEHGWAFDWVNNFLQSGDPEVLFFV